MPLRLALYQPDIPQNTGTILRLARCLGLGVDIVEPCGFVWSDAGLRRAGLDYLDTVDTVRHRSWADYLAARDGCATADHGRLILLTTRAGMPYTGFRFRPGDTLLLGRESAGVPDDVHETVDARVRIPMVPGARSLNVAVAAAMVAGEAVRQTTLQTGEDHR